MLLIFIFIIQSFSSKLNVSTKSCEYFQTRRIYYSEEENVCPWGESTDQINTTVHFNDRESITGIVPGFTYCLPEVLINTLAIRTIDSTTFPSPSFPGNPKISFIQELEKVSIKKRAIYFEKEYDCKVIGDGTISHFGPTDDTYGPSKTHPMPKMTVECEKVIETS